MTPVPEQPDDPPCATIIFRTIRRSSWFDPDDATRVKSDAFMRRQSGDEDGLSLFDSFQMGPDECIEHELSCYGLVSLHVGKIRALGLTVVRDPEDQAHILITDIPLVNPNNADSEHLLDCVADGARIVKKCKWKKPN